MDTVVDRRLVALVDDADGHQQLACADAEAAVDEEIEVGLLELELAFVFAAFDECVLDFELRYEPDAVREAVGEQQHEPAEVDERVRVGRVHELQLHVARQRRDWCRGTVSRLGRLPAGRRGDKTPHKRSRRHNDQSQALLGHGQKSNRPF